MQRKWQSDIEQYITSGRHAIILHGLVNDIVPNTMGAWHDEESVHTFITPNQYSIRVVFDAAGTLTSSDTERFNAILSKDDTTEDDEDTEIARIRRVMRQGQEQESWTLSRVVTWLATTWQNINERILFMMHDTDIAIGDRARISDEKERALLMLYRLAENQEFRRAGHAIIIAVPSIRQLPDRFSGADSPFCAVQIHPPSMKERSAYAKNAFVTEHMKKENDLRHHAALVKRKELAERLTQAKHAMAQEAKTVRAYRPATELSWSELRPGDYFAMHRVAVAPIMREWVVLEKIGSDKITVMDPQTDQQGIDDDGIIILALYCEKEDNNWTVAKVFRHTESGDHWEMVGYRIHIPIKDTKIHQPPSAALRYMQVKAEYEQLNQTIKARDPNTYPDGEYTFTEPKCGMEAWTRLTGGMTFREIHTLLRESHATSEALTSISIAEARKVSIQHRFGDMLEIIDPAYGFEGLAGLDSVVDMLKRIRADMLRGFTARVPMGMMLMGPPGTGKSAIAEAFAKESGMLFVRLKNIRTMWVGETERKQEAVIAAIRSLAPIIVFRDEVDQEDTGRNAFQGDSGVSARIRKSWMEFLSDPKIRGSILVMSATNRPDLLDAALTRSGRSDIRIPFFLPDAMQREAIILVMLRRAKASMPYGMLDWAIAPEELTEIATRTKGMSGADIEAMIRNAIEDAHMGNDETIRLTAQDLLSAEKDFMRTGQVEQIARMTLSAIAMSSRKRFLPPNVEDIISECKAHFATQTPHLAVAHIIVPPPEGETNSGNGGEAN